MVAVARFAGAVLTGIQNLKGKHKGARVVICGSGTTLKDLDLAKIPEHWVVIAVNEAIRKLGSRADYWVLSDEPIVRGYAQHCPKDVVVLAMHNATVTIPKALPDNECYTVNSINKVCTPDDGFNFFSRGTVLIGAVEMMRYAGATRFYCFGLDCYRTEKVYYYDDRKPPMVTEQQCRPEEMGRGLPPGVRIYVTSRLKNMVRKLSELKRGGLWNDVEIHCVNSPYSQQDVVPKLSMEDFEEHVKRDVESQKRKDRRKRAKQKGVQTGQETTEAEGAGEAGGPGDEGGSAHEDGPPDAPVVDRGGDGGGGDSDRSEGGHSADGDAEASDVRGDRDAHGGDVPDGDGGAGEAESPGDVSDD